MEKITIKYYNHSKDLRRLILQLIKSTIATNIIRYNYIKEYTIGDKQDKKTQGIKTLQPKVVSITFDLKNKDKLYDMLTKQIGPDRQDRII